MFVRFTGLERSGRDFGRRWCVMLVWSDDKRRATLPRPSRSHFMSRIAAEGFDLAINVICAQLGTSRHGTGHAMDALWSQYSLTTDEFELGISKLGGA